MNITLRSRLAGRLSLACTLVAPLVSSVSRGQTVPNITVLDPVVVTATRTPTLAEQTAASVTVIGKEQIEQSQFSDVLSALKDVPGLNVIDGGMPGQTAGIFMRGTESRHTVILLDGHRLPTGLQRYFDISYFPTTNLERIEIVRGPLSAAQGDGALGGAINLISRHEATDGVSGEVSGEYGSFDSRRAEASVSAAKNGVYADVGGTYFSTENKRPNSDFEAASTLDTVGWDISPTTKLELLTGYLHRNGGNPGTGTLSTASDPDASLEQNLGFLAPSLTFSPSEAWTHTLDYSYAQQKSFAQQTPYTADNSTEVVTQEASYQVDFKPTAAVSLQAGVERHWQDVDYQPINGNTALPFTRDERSNAAFAGTQVNPFEGVTLVASARRDVYQDFYGSANTWRYGFSYRFGVTCTVLHASDGTAFAAPEIQNFIDFGFGPSATTLRPERSRGQELGITQELGKQATFGATVFQSKTHDLAQYNLATFTVENIGLADIHGLETFAEYRPSKAWSILVNYTYLSAKDEATDLPLLRRPRHTISGEVRYEISQGWIVGAGVRAAMKRYDTNPATFTREEEEDYVVARFFTQYALRENVLLKLRVENAFNEHYAETAGYPALPITIYGGVEWRL